MTSSKPEKVYFYATCLVDVFYQEAGLDGIRLLEREGIEVIFLQGQTCCGQPAHNSGYRREAKAAAISQVKMFAEDIPVVLPSGSCAAMMKHHYPRLFADDQCLTEIQAFSGRVFELSEFLIRVLNVQLVDKGEPIRIAMHTSCHARREMGVAADAEQLLAQLANVELLDQARKTECCGFGGTFAVRHPEISAAMVQDKSAAIEECGAQHLISGDCGCLMNIQGNLEKQDCTLSSEHIASFVLKRTAHES